MTYTVTFNLNNGPAGAKVPAAVTVRSGAKVADPADDIGDITSGDKIVAGWYKDAALTQRWAFDIDKVTANTTLYALWVNDSQQSHTVTFDLSVTSGDAPENARTLAVTSVSVSDGRIITDAPTVTSGDSDGKIVTEWYKDAACTNEWDFARDAVRGDMTLYAKWRDRLGDSMTWYGIDGDTLTIGGRGAMPKIENEK